jgi:hypothetical protein
LDQFNLLAVRLEIQSYYFVPPPTVDKGSLRRNMVRTYHTARALVDLGLRLDATQNFLAHAPYFVFRALMDATSVIVAVLHSVYAADLDMEAGETAVKRAILSLRRWSVRDEDLAARAAKIFESYWSLRHLLPSIGVGMAQFCLRRARRGLEEARKASESQGHGAELHGMKSLRSLQPPSS